MSSPRIRSTAVPPPGMPFFVTIAGTRIEDSDWFRFKRRVEAAMEKAGVKAFVEDLAAAEMCPHCPSWYCENGRDPSSVVRREEAMENGRKYFTMPLVTFHETSERLRTCMACPKHSRELGCLTCSGLMAWILSGFNGRRVQVPEDRGTGTCNCARTLESIVASVDYAGAGPGWDDMPDTCWRRKETK